MPLNLGAAAVAALYLGTAPVSALYLGSDLVWPISSLPIARAAASNESEANLVSSVSFAPPSGTVVGDTMCHVITFSPLSSGFTPPTGWTTVLATYNSQGLVVVRRVATGGADDTFNYTPPASVRWVRKSVSYVGNCTISGSAVIDNQDPPNLDLGTSAPTRWIAIATHSGQGTAVSAGAAPTDYTYSGSVASNGSGSAVNSRLHLAVRELTAQAENPGPFAQTMTALRIVATLGVRRA